MDVEVVDIRITSTEDLVIAYRVTEGEREILRLISPMIIDLPPASYDLGVWE